jgi:hypothetical protein
MDYSSPELPFYKRRPRRISITVPHHIYESLCALSQRQGRSIFNLAAFLLEEWSQRLDRQHKATARGPSESGSFHN